MSRARILADYVSSGDELADKLDLSGGAMTGAITTNSTFDGIDVATRDGEHAPKASPIFTGVATAPSLVLTPGSAPGSPAEGAIYYDSTSDTVKVRNASAFVTLGSVFHGMGGIITIYTDSGTTYRVHTFLTSGTFTPMDSLSVDCLVVGGGGGGGAGRGGGGGAGGMLYRTGLSVTAQSYTITIGGGGSGATSHSSTGSNGVDTVAFSVTAKGGGNGGSGVTGDSAISIGESGGSGGGTTHGADGAIASNQGTFTYWTEKGNAGGNGNSPNNESAGGGGGAGAVGQAGDASGNGGDGGIGFQNDYRIGSDQN